MLAFFENKAIFDAGFTLIEVLVSLTLISAITGFMGLFVFSSRTNKNSKISFDATYIARNNMEMVYGLSRAVDLKSGIDIIKKKRF